MTDIAQKSWDVIVIGAGLGGGICGRALAEAGLSVLFVDRGVQAARDAEGSMDCDDADPQRRLENGCWPAPVEARVDGVTTLAWGGQGTGPGGTSVFYAAAMERPAPHDFDALPDMAHPTGGWPVGYAAFQPWMDRAQQVMAVNGTPDPLSPPVQGLAPPRPLSGRDAALQAAFTAAGLHPYRAHLGIRNLPDCRECIGHKCPRPCKMDGRSAGVEPALATGRAAFLDQAVTLGLEGAGRRIDGIRVRRLGQIRTLRARAYVLAAGGLGSPRLLLASANEAWPTGCGNSSGLVGRGLMFHLTERIAVWPPRRASGTTTGAAKAFSLRDFYRDGDDRLGLFQSLGLPADYGNILHVLRQRYDLSRLAPIPIGKQFLRIPALAAAAILGEARVFAGILEDLPLDDNRVLHDPARPDHILYDYRLSDELLARRLRFRRLIKRKLRGMRSLYLNHGPELNVTHPCGTLRFSHDPRRGVLDPDCRAHDLDNLFVTDSSFMPTSTGVNPGLTIVANALRVADTLAAQLRAGL